MQISTKLLLETPLKEIKRMTEMISGMFEDLGSNLGEPVKERKRTVAQKELVQKTEKWYTILLEENEGIPPTGQFFSVNGRAFILKPGEKVNVPEGIVSILNDAVMSTPIVDSSQTVNGYRDRLRFPYRMYGEVKK